MIYVVSTLCIIQLIIIIALCFYIFKFANTIFDVEDSIEGSLDLMDESYKKISEISEKPVFFDSVEVRQVINEIEKVREAILKIANSFTKISNDKEENNKDKQA